METNAIIKDLSQFHGTEEYHKHLFPGKFPLLLTDGCKYVRDDLKSNWLFDAIISYQTHKALRDVNFQIWELKQLKKDFTWLLTCREDTGRKPFISQSIEFSDFPLDYRLIKLHYYPLNTNMKQSNRKYIEELFKYCSISSIMVINEAGELQRLNCPFLVVARFNVGELIKDELYWVSAVKMDDNLLDVYIIKSKAYFFYNFRLLGRTEPNTGL